MSESLRERVVRVLTERFGKPHVRVRSEYHIQVIFAPKVHEVWVRKDGRLKAKLAGHAAVQFYSTPEAIADSIGGAGGKQPKSDVEQMNTARDLAVFLDRAQEQFAKADLPEAIYCDAGWREGVARVAWVHISGGGAGPSLVAHVAHLYIDATHKAELEAIRRAAAAVPSVPIFSDNEGAVQVMRKEIGERVRWLVRHKNKGADSIAHLRGKRMEAITK